MRKFSGVLALSLFASFALTPISEAATQPSAGKSCTVIGENQFVAKKAFLCANVGNKSVWKVLKDNAAYDQVSISGRRFSYSYLGNMMRRTSATGGIFSADSRKLNSLDKRLVKTFTSIKSSMEMSHPNITFNYVENLNYPADLQVAIKKELDLAANYWNSKIPSPIDVNVVFATEKDISKMSTDWSKYLSPNLIPGMTNQLEEYKDSGKFYMRSGTGGGTVEPYRDSSGQPIRTIFFHTASYAKMNTFWPEIAAHEFVHVIQEIWIQQASFSSRESYSAAFPTTLIEGSANTMSYLMTFPNAGWASDEFLTNSYGVAGTARDEFPMRTTSDVIDALNKMEMPVTNKAFDASYAVGSYLFLWLLSEYGTDSYTKLFANCLASKSFDKGLHDTYGITKAELYQKAAPYILEKWNYK